MKRHELFFWMIKLPIEFLIVYLSFFVALDIRRVTDLIPWIQIPYRDIFSQSDIVPFAILWWLLYVVVFAYLWLYQMQIRTSRVKQFASIIEWASFWFLIYIWCLYLSLWFIYTKEIPRLIVLFAIVMSTFWVFLERLLLDYLQKYFLELWLLEKTKIALVLNEPSQELVDEIESSNIYDIIGYFNKKEVEWLKLEYLWWSSACSKILSKRHIEEIFYISSSFLPEEIEEIFEYSRIYWISYKYIANSFDFTKNNIETSFINKIPVVEIRSIWLSAWWRILKRIFDIVSSWLGLILLSPIFIIVSILEVKEAGGLHIFYWSKRVWKNSRLFKMYKFRSMEIDAEKKKKDLLASNERKDWPLFKIENDPRITKLWAFLRKYDIDELPQLWNVFIWDMSLIWPRPHLPEEVALYKEYQKRVLTLKPWITWMAQTHWRHKNTFEDEVRLDIFYIENWSLLLDIKILIKTIKVVFSKQWR